MKKVCMAVLTTAMVVSGSVAAFAGSRDCVLQSGGKGLKSGVYIGSLNGANLNGLDLSRLCEQILAGNNTWRPEDGKTPVIPDLPDFDKPEINWPDGFPDFDFPGNDTEIEKPDQGGTEKPEQPDEGSQNNFASQVAKLVNEERAKAGLPALSVSAKVQSAANLRAKEIEQSFSHTRPGGQSFQTALTEKGVSFRGAGENIAYGQRSAEEVMKSWMNSSGHRANILNKSFTEIGVGVYQAANGTIYWTQLFTN